MSLARLATVELQLILQCCDRTTLLQFARCCKFVLTAASSDFAWRFLSPLRMCYRDDLASLLSSSRLLRHCDVALHFRDCDWSSELAAQVSARFTGVVALVPRMVRLDVSDLSDAPLQSRALAFVLSSPGVRASLTSLRLEGSGEGGAMDFRSMQAVANLPKLQRLEIYRPEAEEEEDEDENDDEDDNDDDDEDEDGEDDHAHAAATSDSDEEDNNNNGVVDQDHIAAAAAAAAANQAQGMPRRRPPPRLSLPGPCALLRSLRVEEVGGVSLVSLLCSPGLKALQELHLESVMAWADESVKNEWRKAFAALEQLRSITLEECSPSSLLVRALQLPNCPVLEVLRVELSGILGSEVQQTAPSTSVLREFLKQRAGAQPQQGALSSSSSSSSLRSVQLRLPRLTHRLQNRLAWRQLSAGWYGLARLHPRVVEVTEAK